MTENEFREALWNGQGRARLFARDHDVSAFRATILDACLHCYAVDPQCEGTRAPYMTELIQSLPDFEFYREEILNSLAVCEDDWHTVQRFRIAIYFAMDGDEEAKRLAYEHFNPGPRRAESNGVDFVRMDGMDGFLFAAEKVGALLLERPREVDEGFLISHATDRFGEEATFAALTQAGVKNPSVDAYRLHILAKNGDTDRHTTREVRAMSYWELKPSLLEVPRFSLARWGQDASTDDLKRAARDLLVAPDDVTKLRYLQMFRRAPFPLDPEELLTLLQADDSQVSRAVAAVLEKIAHPIVRQLAFQMMQDGHPQRSGAIGMLTTNFVPGDHPIALDWFAGEPDREVRHSMTFDLKHLWAEHPLPSLELDMLLALYERGPCSFCREFIVSRLVELDALTPSMREDCRFDANDEVRGVPTTGRRITANFHVG